MYVQIKLKLSIEITTSSVTFAVKQLLCLDVAEAAK